MAGSAAMALREEKRTKRKNQTNEIQSQFIMSEWSSSQPTTNKFIFNWIWLFWWRCSCEKSGTPRRSPAAASHSATLISFSLWRKEMELLKWKSSLVSFITFIHFTHSSALLLHKSIKHFDLIYWRALREKETNQSHLFFIWFIYENQRRVRLVSFSWINSSSGGRKQQKWVKWRKGGIKLSLLLVMAGDQPSAPPNFSSIKCLWFPLRQLCLHQTNKERQAPPH